MPIDTILVRRLDPARSCVETVARGGREVVGAGRDVEARAGCGPTSRPTIWSGWRDGAAGARCIAGQTGAVRRRLPGLLPEGLDGPVLAGPLLVRDAPAGVLLLVSAPRHELRDEHGELMQALLEPFAVALENDHRLRELVSLREALEADKRSLLSRLDRHDISDSIVGADTGLKPVMEQIELVARSDTPVLILGETGAGKEVVARAIHQRSRRASGPFLRVNCGAIPPDLVDSELFGHEKGSFTGAVGTRQGWFERADGGRSSSTSAAS